MDFLDAARKIVCNIVAVALAMTVSTVEALLPTRPDWLERVNELALQLKTIYEKDRTPPRAASVVEEPAEEPAEKREFQPAGDTERLLLAYNRLWQFVQDVRSDGLLLDDKFCERVEREWTVTTLMSYVRNADRSLQEKAGATLDAASVYLASPSPDSNRPA